jgi:surface antigen
VGAAAQTLTITGTGFLATSTVTFNSIAHTATYVSASQLTISLTTADLSSAGSYPVVVTNPTPGGGSSAPDSFTVSATNPVPTVASLSPSSLTAGATAQTLTITGTGFLSTSTVTFNSVAHAATYVSSSQLTISLTTADLATAGSYPVVVTNPAPGGGSSSAATFTVSASNPIPTISLLTPTSLAAGATAQTLTINGSGFLVTSTVTFNGVPHSPTYVSASQLTISLTTADLAMAGSYPVVVTNPAPGGGSSSAVNFTVSASNPIPTLSIISPNSVAAGALDTQIELVGTGFTSQTLVYFGSLALQTSYVSSTQLSAVIPSAQLASAGTGVVIVTTPAPGGGTSSAAQFTITSVIAAAKLVLLAVPAYAGSPNGPWQLSVAAADANGNPVPNLPVTVSSSEGTIAQNSTTTDSTGSLSASITPPATYAGEVVEVSAVSGNQTAVVDLTFTASTTSVIQQAAVKLNATHTLTHSDAVAPTDSSSSTSSQSTVSQLMIGTSNGASSSNLFSGMLSPCTSNQGLDTTLSVDCQSVFSAKQVQNTPFTPGNSACQQVSTYTTLAECAGAAGIAVACASPETGVGAAICVGGWTAGLPQSCLLDLGTDIAKSLIKNQLAQAGVQTTVDLVSTAADPGDPTHLVDVLCDAYESGNAGTVMSVFADSSTVSLGGTVTLTADRDATWQVVGSGVGTALGTVSPTPATSTTYQAPSVAPQGTYCNFMSPYYVDSCPITIVTTSATPPTVQTLTTILLSIGTTDAPPVIQSLAPNPVAAGSSGVTLSINGTGFLAGDTVTFNGSSRTPVFIGPNQFQIALSAVDLASPGSYPVVVSRDYFAIASSNGSSTQNLIVNTSATAVPQAPTPTSPGTPTDTGAPVSTTTPTLQWTGTNATQYDLAISQYPYGTGNVVFDSGILNGGQTSLVIPAGYLSNGVKYRWNMQAHNSAGWSGVSSSLYFTVGAGSLPSTPGPISPGTGTDTGYTVSSITPTMQWSGSGATTYEMAISQSPYGPSNVIYDNAQLSGSAVSLPVPTGVLQNGVKYRWDIQATNAAGQSSWSSPLYFTVATGSGEAPPVPTPLSPGTTTDTNYEVTTTNPTLNWNGTGATQYELAVSYSPYGSSNVVYDVLLAGTLASQTIPTGILQSGWTYRWNLQATNSSGQSDWSAPLYFTVNTGGTVATIQVGSRVMAAPGSACQPGGANVRDEGLDTVLFQQCDGVHGSVKGFESGTADGFTGNWLQIEWDSEPPNQNSIWGWSANSVIALAPASGDVVQQPNFSTNTNYTTNNKFYPSFAPNAPSNQLEGALGNCTWYVYGRLLDLQATKSQLSYFTGNADTWATAAPSGWVSTTPSVHSIAELDANSGFPLGHVAFVESLNADGTITVTESSSGLDPTGNWMFLWRNRTVSPNWFSHFINVPVSGSGTTPAVPASLTPGSTTAPGPTTSSTSVTLSWSGTSGASYEVAVKDVATGTFVMDTTTTSTTFTANLTAGKQYAWNVDACNGSLCSAFATAEYFQTPGTAPAVPTNLTPGSATAPGPTTGSTSVTLSWTGTSGASYEVAVKDVAAGTFVVDTTTTSTTFTANLSAGKQYTWNVDACNGSLCSAFASAEYFQTPGTKPAVPTNLSPGSTSSPGPTTSSSSVTLSWTGTSGASYEVAVKDVATGTFVVDTTTTSITFTANLTAGKQYAWNVDACTGSLCSNFAQAEYFQTPATTPAVPTNLSPGSTSSPGPTTSSTTVTLSWSGTSGATYEVAIKDVATGTFIDDTTISATTFTATNLVAGKKYTWNVDACNGTLCSAFAQALYFQTP